MLIEGWLDDMSIADHYAGCRAFVFCGEEDFGISLLEAQAMGRPVIALGRGGALETVIPDRKTWKPGTEIPEKKTINPTGVFFYEQTSEEQSNISNRLSLNLTQRKYKYTQRSLMLLFVRTELKSLLKKDLKNIDAEETWSIISYHSNFF